MSLAEDLKALGHPHRPLTSARLVKLSNLSPAELEEAKDAWAEIDPFRRLQIVCHLVELAEENVELDFTAILKHCLTDPDPEVRAEALGGLWECEERALIEKFVEMMRRDPAEQVRAAAAVALGRFVLLDEFGKLRLADAIQPEEALFAVIADATEAIEVRRRAVEAVGALSGERTRVVIQEAYDSDHREMRLSAIYAMGQSCDPRWLPLVSSQLHSHDPAFRYNAARALGNLGNEANVPALLDLLADEDVQIKTATIFALGQIGGPVAKKKLEECLESDDLAIREAAGETLEELLFREDPLRQP